MSVSFPTRRQLTCVSPEPDCERPTLSCVRWPEARCVICCQPQNQPAPVCKRALGCDLKQLAIKLFLWFQAGRCCFAVVLKHVGFFVGIWNKEAVWCCYLKQGCDVCVVIWNKEAVFVFSVIWNEEAMFVLWSETRRKCLCCDLKQGGDVCVVIWNRRCLCCDLKQAMFVLWSETGDVCVVIWNRRCLCCDLKQAMFVLWSETGDVCVVIWNRRCLCCDLKQAMFVLWFETRRRCLYCDLKQGGDVCIVIWNKEAMFVLWSETRRRCLYCDLKQGGSVCVVMAEGELLVHGVATVLMMYRSFLCWKSICFFCCDLICNWLFTVCEDLLLLLRFSFRWWVRCRICFFAKFVYGCFNCQFSLSLSVFPIG